MALKPTQPFIVRALGSLAVLAVLAAPALGQDPGAGKPLPPRDPTPDSTRAVAAPPPVAPQSTAPERLDLTPPTPGAPANPTAPASLPAKLHGEAWYGRQEFQVWGRYNRVEGPALHVAVVRRLQPKGYIPAFRAQMGFAFSADRGEYLVGFEQPVANRHRVTLGAQGYRSFVPFYYADESLSSEENSASAMFLHRDYWDWFETEGVRGYVGFYPSKMFTVTAGVRKQDEASLQNATDWSVFNQQDDFVQNPSVPEGDYRGYEATATYDSRPQDNEGNIYMRPYWGSWAKLAKVTWERGGGGLGGDFDEWRVTADLRNYFRLAPNQSLSARILAGTGEGKGGSLPAGRRYEIGGLGTLRGHNYRSLGGDHVALANLQYAFGVSRQGWLLFFADLGTAWDAGNFFDQHIPIDLGTGFRLGESGPTLLVAHPLNESGGDTHVEFRFQESY
jgi:outer membrane protein assembly factor BamA